MIENRGNWARNYEYRAAMIHEPETVEEIQELVRRGDRVKALGTRHSFNDIADSPGDLISLKQLNKILRLDPEQHTVTIEGGVRYGELCRWLDREGFALHNLASLPHISVAGACATATHGSGDRNGNLSTAVAALEIVRANGELSVLSRDDDQFEGEVVGLGGLGIVTKLTLDISPSFEMQQDVYENLTLADLEDHFDELTSSAYSVSLFTDWNEARFNQVWLKRLAEDGVSHRAEPELFGARLASRNIHPIAALSAENCTGQMGICGPWYERLPHFRLEFMPSSGEELQSEYLLPREHAIPAFHALNEIREFIAPLLQISEVRTIAADQLWMSPSYERASVAIHFTWKKDWDGVRQILPILEQRLSKFEPRPHWGKLFTIAPDHVQTRYPKLPEFRRLLEKHDPQGMFRNEFLDQYVYGRL